MGESSGVETVAGVYRGRQGGTPQTNALGKGAGLAQGDVMNQGIKENVLLDFHEVIVG